MKKTYEAPAVVRSGDLMNVTRTVAPGGPDGGIGNGAAVGTVGFLL